MKIKLVGVVNVTPDSFSDGGCYYSAENALKRYYQLISDGADYVEFGADSSRPGSVCVGFEEEIRRLSFINPDLKYGVDTHFSETAQFAIDRGAEFINDISGGSDRKIFSILKDKKIILMNSRGKPHDFSNVDTFNFETVITKLHEIIKKTNLSREQIIIDPGIGGFISDNPQDSIDLLDNFNLILDLGFSVMLGLSRKNFLRSFGCETIDELDYKGLELTKNMVNKFERFSNTLYLRVHNVKIYQGL